MEDCNAPRVTVTTDWVNDLFWGRWPTVRKAGIRVLAAEV
ncbi:hypothetical protein Rleg2_4893 (plasmid) [Rhizobium leguminosarum bv. trifolii WSM2304]|uniref:Uncharacterized protein n=1 Tax=Rhizobium leguminosarum bv. trifolii (strain WSM2304) TaxID=395492 RepID=A0ABF7QV36_RHILW|nr:hypothetical protein Rleg2_4893 [Rhizobium leguminosarum bv. trifolii WSM2304]